MRWFLSIIVAALLILIAAVVLVVLSVCGNGGEPSDEQAQIEAAPHQLTRVVDAEAGSVVPGRVRIALDESLWHREFPAESPADEPDGIQRLNLSPELRRLFDSRCFALQRVWRSWSQLERQRDDRIQVITYAEWVEELHGRQGVRENAQDYDPPELAGIAGRFELKFPDEADLSAIVEAIRTVPGVISAEIVVEPILEAPSFPDDPGWVDTTDPSYDETLARGRWGFHNTGAALDPSFLDDFDIDAPEAWEYQRGSPAYTVAVFDNGVDVTHEDLYLNVFLNNSEVPSDVVSTHQGASADDGLPGELTFYDLNVPTVVTDLAARGWSDTNGNGYVDGQDVVTWWSDGVDDGTNGYEDDIVGWDFLNGDNKPFGAGDGSHGTPVSGLIAAVADNGTGIAGVASRVRILPVLTDFDIAEIAYVSSFLSVRVINHSMSWGFGGGTPADINAMLATLEPEGILYVGSLGNLNAFYYGGDPSQREQVVSVGNFEANGARSRDGGSGYGPKTDVAAPGTSLYSLASGGGTRWFGGTSAASPVTAGIASLIMSQAPALTPEQVRQVLRMTADDPAPVPGDEGENTAGWDLYSGWGLANANSAISFLRDGKVPSEANILSLHKNYSSTIRDEEFAIRVGPAPIRAYLGLPSGGTVDWALRMAGPDSAGEPDWDLSGATQVASGTGVPYNDGTTTIHTIDTDPLDGPQVIELEVTTAAGVVSRDRAVIDLPRAYISNLAEEGLVVESTPIYGFAYGPGFVRYRLLIAPGWTPAPGDFVELTSSTTQKAPTIPAEAGRLIGSLELLPELDIFALPVTLPASGEATLRLITEGARDWTFDQHIIIDNVQPPHLAGFPVPGFFTSTASLTAADLDGDGQRELVAAGSGSAGVLQAFRADGTEPPGWPVILPAGELITHTPAVGDVDGDGRPEIVLRTWPSAQTNNIRIVNHDGTLATPGWPVSVDDPDGSYTQIPEQNPPVLADVTLDGRLDILVSIERSLPAVPQPIVRAYGGDGTAIRDYSADGAEKLISAPAVGDIDGDGEIEIAAVARTPGLNPQTLYVWNRDGTLAWSTETSTVGNWGGGPILADIDGDDRLEIAVGVGWDHIRVLDDDGSELWTDAGQFSPRLAFAQMQPTSASNDLSLIVGNRRSVADEWGSYVRAFDASSGSARTGWSGVGIRFADGDAKMQPVVANLRGDADLESAYGNAPGPSWMDPDPDFQLALAEPNGAMVSDSEKWPLRFLGGLQATPLVADLNNDGSLELSILTSRPSSRIYVYDLPASAGPGAIAWGEFAHDPHRTSNYNFDVRILSPTTASLETVGPHDDQDAQALLLVRTRFSRGAPAGGSTAANWEVSVGGVTAGIRDVALVQGEHWLLVEPVVQPNPGTYDLRVEFNDGGIRTWDAYRDAVSYEPPTQDHTQIAVLDRSGSMLSANKIEAARVAGRFFMESAYPDDEVGVVSFDTAATDDLGAGLVTASTNRALVSTAITDVTPTGPSAMTSIGVGLDLALDLLETGATTTNRWGIVLLSDGLENTAPFWTRPGSVPPIRPRAESLMTTHPDFGIHTIALGPDADQALMEEIATVTGGTYYPVYLGSSLSIFNRLADVYHAAREQIDGTQRLLAHGELFNLEETWDERVAVPERTRRLQFALNWDRPFTQAEEHTLSVLPVGIQIRRPDGTLVGSGDAGVQFVTSLTDVIFSIPSPEPGEWAVALTGRHREAVEALLVVSADIPVHLETVMGPTTMVDGVPNTTLTAFLVDKAGFVPTVTLTASVTRADKEVAELRMMDDGKHGDGAEGDGVFGVQVPWDLPGSYLIGVEARGDTASGPTRVIGTRGYFNSEGSDRDGDGLPDEWERRNSPVCGTALHPKGDPDGDGLANATEWSFGSDPFTDDTDGDGRSDGLEFGEGTNPTDPEE